MSAPFSCGWCAQGFWRRGEWNAHEIEHRRAERPDFEAEGAAARAAGVVFDACPWPARTWPEIEWRRGWLLQDLRKDAA